MTTVTIADAYREFSDLHGSERPIWTRDQFQNWVQARHIRYEDLTSDDYGRAIDDETTEVA